MSHNNTVPNEILVTLLNYVEDEIRQRKESGNDEEWAELEAAAVTVRAHLHGSSQKTNHDLEIETKIGTIGNYYGYLTASTSPKGVAPYFWSIENWDGHHWEEIPEYLYEALMRFERERT